jgi:hypothetical protein
MNPRVPSLEFWRYQFHRTRKSIIPDMCNYKFVNFFVHIKDTKTVPMKGAEK